MNLSKYRKQHIVDDESGLIPELISLLAEEFFAWYGYYIAKPFLVGEERKSIEDFFKEAGDDELNDHANKLINRLSELNSPVVLTTPEAWRIAATAVVPVPQSSDVMDHLVSNIQAETDAINHYTKVIELATAQQDFVTADILKEILADENEHLNELNNFLNDIQS